MNVDSTLKLLLAIFTTFMASSGFWAYLANRKEKKRIEEDRNSATTRLLMGLAYDKLIFLGLKHVERGYITGDEYEDFRKYLWEPYEELGGNGTADRVMEAVSKLPLKRGAPIQQGGYPEEVVPEEKRKRPKGIF